VIEQRYVPQPVVDPQMQAILARIAEVTRGWPDYPALPPEAARAQFRRLHARWNTPRPPMRRTLELEVPLAWGSLAARYYEPVDECLGLVLYLHGGGWMLGDLDTHDRAARMLALASNACVLSLAYRLAPEHPFPAPLEDVLGAVDWLSGELGVHGTPKRLALAGDSAGANLALAALLELRARGGPTPVGAALFYGVYDQDWESASQRAFGDGRFGLTTERMRWYAGQYLGGRTDLARDPRVSPVRGELRGLPPLFVAAAGLDPLLDDSLALARRLEEAGTPCELRIYEGVAHGFMQMSSDLDAARRAFDDAGAALGRMLAAA
jgi:acetyl esterase